MLQDTDIKAVLTDASAFFKNYSQQSLNIQPMAQSLAQLNGRLDSVTQAITSATKQAERNAEASGKLAESLNRFTQLLVIATFCLVFVGIAQIVVAIVHH